MIPQKFLIRRVGAEDLYEMVWGPVRENGAFVVKSSKIWCNRSESSVAEGRYMMMRDYKGPERWGPDMLIKFVLVGLIIFFAYLILFAPRREAGCDGDRVVWMSDSPSCQGVVKPEE